MAAAVRENEIGAARCPLCASGKASLRLSARGLVYLTCNACNCQIFARSERSDERLRDLRLASPADLPPIEPPPAPIAPPAKPPITTPPLDKAEKAQLVKIGFFG